MYILGFIVAFVACFWWFWKRNSAPVVVPKRNHRRQSEGRIRPLAWNEPAELDLSRVPSLTYWDFVADLEVSAHVSERVSDVFRLDRTEPSSDFALVPRAVFSTSDRFIFERTLAIENAALSIDEYQMKGEKRDCRAIEPSPKLALVPWPAFSTTDSFVFERTFTVENAVLYIDENWEKGEERCRRAIEPSLALVPWPLPPSVDRSLNSTFVIEKTDVMDATFVVKGTVKDKKKGDERKMLPRKPRPVKGTRSKIPTLVGRRPERLVAKKVDNKSRACPPRENTRIESFENVNAKSALLAKLDAERSGIDVAEAISDPSYLEYYADLLARVRASRTD